MRIWMRRGVAAVLVMALLCPGSMAFATEPTGTPAEPAAETAPLTPETVPAETIPEETVPEETVPEETVPEETVPEETVPEETEPHTYVIDTESDMYRLCDELAAEMTFDQLLVYDATNDEIFYTNTREGDKLYPASITKLFSAYVALQYLKPKDEITAKDELALVQPGSSVAYIGRWSRLYAQTVVEGMMLPSGNDAAMVLAAAAGRKIAGNDELPAEEAVQTFVAEMNRMAGELGFERSHFSNPDGWHTGSHYTCLNDMARIAKLALENKTISRYMRTAKDEVYFLTGHRVEWENTNCLLTGEDGFYRGDAIGMKTGYTRQAEYSLMSAFSCSDGRKLVIGVFGYADEKERFRDVIKLADACKEQLKIDAQKAKSVG